MGEPMRAAVFICRSHGANLMAYRGLMKHPLVGHSEALPSCCSQAGRDQIRLHLFGGKEQALLVLGCRASELGRYQEVAASAGVSPDRVAVVPYQQRTASAAEFALARALDGREPVIPREARDERLLLLGEGHSFEAAAEQAAKEGLVTIALSPDGLDAPVRLLGGPGAFTLEAGEIIYRFGAALLAFDLQVEVTRETPGEGPSVVLLVGGEECRPALVRAVEGTLAEGRKAYIVSQESPFSGSSEGVYRALQARGATFLRAAEAEVSAEGVRVHDEHLGETVLIEAGEVVTIASHRPMALDRVLGVFGLPPSRRPLGPAPGDSGVPGVVLCGSALSGHRDGSETQAARAAAVSLARELRSPAPRTPKARVDRERCSKCLTCLRLCPYGAPSLEHGEVVVSVERCQGCGLCVAMCPAMAIEMPPSDLRAEVGATRMGGMG